MHAPHVGRFTLGNFCIKPCIPVRSSWRTLSPSRGNVGQYASRQKFSRQFGSPRHRTRCQAGLATTLQVTKVKLQQKQQEGIAEARSGRRSPGSVWGSGSAGTACAVAALLLDNAAFWQVGFVASFVSKFSDTVSSEIGKAYGKTAYLITTLKIVPRGTEGAVSLEGTAAGIAAAALFGGLALGLKLVAVQEVGVVTGAAVIANLFESYLGAVLQGKAVWVSNDVVNGIQISLAAVVALLATAYLSA